MTGFFCRNVLTFLKFELIDSVNFVGSYFMFTLFRIEAYFVTTVEFAVKFV